MLSVKMRHAGMAGVVGSVLACGELPTGAERAPDEVANGEIVRDASRPFHAGVFLGDEATTPERVRGALAEFSAMVGSRPAWVKSFHDLDADLSANGWAGRVLREIAAEGTTNYVALDLSWLGRSHSQLLDAVNAGEADARFARAASAIAGVPGVVLVEPGWEMNGDWAYDWQGAANGGTAAAPVKFAEAWRRLVGIFREAGATNVRWVFNPNAGNPLAAGSPGSSHWNWWGNYYPGDDYVDFVGAHAFNGPSVWGHAYHSFDAMFYGRESDGVMRDMAQRHSTKPIIVGEFATEEAPGHDKGEWIRSAYDRLQANPNVAGAIWFHMDKESDWRVNSSPASLAAYRQAVMRPFVATAYREATGVASAMVAGR